MIYMDQSSPCLNILALTKSIFNIKNTCFPTTWMNCLASFKDGFQPWSSLLNDRSWSLDIRDYFATRVANACIEGVTNWDQLGWVVQSSFLIV